MVVKECTKKGYNFIGGINIVSFMKTLKCAIEKIQYSRIENCILEIVSLVNILIMQE